MMLFARALEHVSRKRGSAGGGLAILDIGGTFDFWRMNARYLPGRLIDVVEVVNLPPFEEREEEVEGVRLVGYAGDALDRTSMRHDRYDVVHNNSVIEHVGGFSEQKRFSDTISSLAEHHFIQTPCRTFPIEPHFYFPFFALYPLCVRSWLFRHMNLGFMGREPDRARSRMLCEQTRLLTKRELMSLFPGSDCLPERLFGMVKSWVLTNMADEAMRREVLRTVADS